MSSQTNNLTPQSIDGDWSALFNEDPGTFVCDITNGSYAYDGNINTHAQIDGYDLSEMGMETSVSFARFNYTNFASFPPSVTAAAIKITLDIQNYEDDSLVVQFSLNGEFVGDEFSIDIEDASTKQEIIVDDSDVVSELNELLAGLDSGDTLGFACLAFADSMRIYEAKLVVTVSMTINKVVFGGNTLIDLSNDTVTANDLAQGVTAHDKNGAQITGTVVSPTLISKTITANGTYNASADNADGYSSVEVNCPDTALALINQTISGTVVIPSGVTTIRRNLFQGCSAIQSFVIPSSLTTLQDAAFHGTSSLQSFTFSPGMTLGTNCFTSSGLSEADLTGITTLGGASFSACNQLKTVKISSSVASIGPNAFNNCYRMETFDFTGLTITNGAVDTALANVNAFNNTNNAPMVFATQAIMQVYAGATNWSTYASRMTYVGA